MPFVSMGPPLNCSTAHLLTCHYTSRPPWLICPTSGIAHLANKTSPRWTFCVLCMFDGHVKCSARGNKSFPQGLRSWNAESVTAYYLACAIAKMSCIASDLLESSMMSTSACQGSYLLAASSGAGSASSSSSAELFSSSASAFSLGLFAVLTSGRRNSR